MSFHFQCIRGEIIIFLWLAGVTTALAQLGNPDEKFSLTATVEGSPNANFDWEAEPSGTKVGEGRTINDVGVQVDANIRLMKEKGFTVALQPFYSYSSQQLVTNWQEAQWAVYLPPVHHHFGGSLVLSYQTTAWGKPLTLIGYGAGNFSQYGFENASGLLGSMINITRNKNTYLALGAIFLMGSAVKWPLYPMIVYKHRFNNRWSVDCFATNNFLFYHVSPKLKYSFGMELDTYKFYFRPDVDWLPKKAVVTEVSERVGLFADWQLSPQLSLNAGAGVQVPILNRLQESGKRHVYMTLTNKVKPFIKMKIKVKM